MKRVAILVVVLVAIVCVGSCAGERKSGYPGQWTLGAQSFKVYDQDWNVQGHVKKGSFAPWYYIYDKDWNVKGYVKWNSFSERYELYDEKSNRKGYLEGN